MFKRIIGLEELEVDKLKEKQLALARGDSTDVLYDNLKQQDEQEANKEEPIEAEDTPVDSTDGQDVEEPEETPDEEEVALESIRNEVRDLTYGLENFMEEPSGFLNTSKEVASAVIAGVAAALVTLGIVYGPTIIKNVFKGVLYVFTKLAKLLYVSTVMISKYIDRRIHSFNNLKERTANLKKSIELLKARPEKSEAPSSTYSNQSVINAIKIGNSVDLVSNIQKLTKFVNTTVTDLDKQITNDIGSVRHIISYSQVGTKAPDSILTVKPVTRGLTRGELPGFNLGNEFTETYKYNEALPSDVVLMASLPRHDLTSFEDIAKGYSGSSIILGLDQTSFKEVNSIDYMTLDDLSKLLDVLDKLSDLCISHQSLYEKVKRMKVNMKYSFKNYFMSIVDAPQKVSLKSSLVEYVYLKNMFIDKVYLVAAMDIHDYCARTIGYNLSYIEDNIKKLS